MIASLFTRICVVVFCSIFPSLTQADEPKADISTFFKSKQVTLYIGTAVGGGYDAYARLLARHIGAHIPGNPSVVPMNMPGAGGAVLISYLLNSAARDGSIIAALPPGALTAPLYDQNKRYDARALAYLGSANSEDDGCWARADAPVKSYSEVFSKQLLIGASPPGDTTFDLPTLQNNILGTRFKIVTGYAGSNDVVLALDRNEVQGVCGLGVPAMLSKRRNWVETGFIKMLVQENSDGSPALNKAGVPRTIEFAKTDEDRQALGLVYIQQKFGRPFAMPPNAPADRVAVLRRAFLEALHDKELNAEAKKMNLDIEATSGEELQRLIRSVYETPRPIAERAGRALGYVYKP